VKKNKTKGLRRDEFGPLDESGGPDSITGSRIQRLKKEAHSKTIKTHAYDFKTADTQK